MHPQIEVVVDGTPVAGAFYERLVRLSVTDKDGVSSDTFEAELNDGPPDFLTIPRKGAIVDIRVGYRQSGLRSLGTFTVDKVSGKCLPYSLSLSGKAADLRKGKLKEHRVKHWDQKTLQDVVGEKASEAGLSSSIDSEIGAFKYEWLAQQDETDIQFLERLARRHDAIFTIKNGHMLFAKKGAGESASGSFLGSVIVTPDMVVQGSLSFETNDRTQYSKVAAFYQDRDKAERVQVEVDADTDGDSDSVYRIPETFADAAEADKAASAKAKQIKRGEGDASVTVFGDTTIVSGAPLIFESIRPGLDGVPYVIDTVTHEVSKSGFTTKISAKLYDGKSAGGKGSSGSGSGDGANGGSSSAGTDKVADNAPSGTPATPSQWTTPRRSGLTDAN